MERLEKQQERLFSVQETTRQDIDVVFALLSLRREDYDREERPACGFLPQLQPHQRLHSP
jgi:hypothetical protein